MALSTPSTYFAAAPPDEIGSRILERVERNDASKPLAEIRGRLADCWRNHYGFDPAGFHSTSAIARGGEQGELAIMRVNHARSLVNTLTNLIVAPKLVWTPKAVNIDYASVRQTHLAAAVLEYYWQQKNVARYCGLAVEEAIAFTEGFVFLEWDDQAGEDVMADETGRVVKSGDLRMQNVSTWDVIRDPSKSAWTELDWVIVKTRRNKYDLAARFPDQEEAILGTTNDDVRPMMLLPKHQGLYQSDDVNCFYFYHLRTPSMPQGRETVVLGHKVVLKDQPLSYDDIPLHRVSPAEIIGTPYGYSPYLEILGIQEIADSLHSAVATNQTTFATQCIAIQEGSQVPIDEIAGGMKAIYYPQGAAPPAPLQLTKSPPEVFTYLNDLRQSQELIFGLNSVVRGQMDPTGKTSGSALALLQSQALQQASVLQGNYIQMVEAIGNSVIRILKRNCFAPRKVALAGKRSSFLVAEEEYSGESFGQVYRVIVEVGNPLSQTAAGRVEMAKEMLQMGFISTPEQYEEVLKTGRLDPLTHGVQDELLLILSENENIAKGITPPVMIHDNALLHCREHRSTVASPVARQDPTILKAATDHIHAHYAAYYGIPVLPEQAPDPMTGALVPMDPYGAVLADPMYRERILFLMGMQPPPPQLMAPMMAPPGAPGAPPPGGPPDGGGPPPEMDLGGGELPGELPNLPRQPTNPATGSKWNPIDGGGAVPRPG